MAKRILVPVERTKEMEFVLSVVRSIARASGGVVRLVAVLPIPKPLCDKRDRVIVSTEQQIERLERRTADELRRLAVICLDGVAVETTVIFGDRAVEVGVEAECFGADLVVLPPERRRGPAASLAAVARRLIAGRPAAEVGVLRRWALRAESTV